MSVQGFSGRFLLPCLSPLLRFIGPFSLRIKSSFAIYFLKNKIRKCGKSLSPRSKNTRAVALPSVTVTNRGQCDAAGRARGPRCPWALPPPGPAASRRLPWARGSQGLAAPRLACSKWQWRWNRLPPLPLKWRIKLQLERNGAQQPALENPTHNGIKNMARGAGRAPQPPALPAHPLGAARRPCAGRPCL